MISLGQMFMIIGTTGLVWYVWGYYMGGRDERRKYKKRN